MTLDETWALMIRVSRDSPPARHEICERCGEFGEHGEGDMLCLECMAFLGFWKEPTKVPGAPP